MVVVKSFQEMSKLLQFSGIIDTKSFKGHELKKLGLTFLKHTTYDECHGGLQYPIEGGWVQDVNEFDDCEEPSSSRVWHGPGLYFCAQGHSLEWLRWLGPDCVTRTGEWQRSVDFDDQQEVIAIRNFNSIIFKTHRFFLGPREPLADHVPIGYLNV